MTIGNRGLAGQPILPYTDFRSYVGADLFIDLTFLDHTLTEVVPTSAQYQLDDITNDINMVPLTSLILSQSISFSITAANATTAPYGTGSGNGFYLGTFNGNVSCGSISPVNQQIQGANIAVCASETVGATNSFTFCLQGTFAQNYFTSLSFTDRLGAVDTYLAANATFSTSAQPGYSIWTWTPPVLNAPFTPASVYTVTLAGITQTTPVTPSQTLQIPGAKMLMTYPYQGSQLCQLCVTSTFIDSVTGNPASATAVAILELLAVQTPGGTF
jgi:hypothetical protein